VTCALLRPFERRLLERFRRRAELKLQRAHPRIVAVTGSWGKTSTKHHIHDLVMGQFETCMTPASWNNTAGLARAINDRLTKTREVFIAERGMYRRGEIRAMCSWVPPSVAVICSIGPMHLERAGSIENIVAGKAEILEGAPAAVLWVDNPHLDELARSRDRTTVWRVGTCASTDLDVEVREEGGVARVLRHDRELASFPTTAGVHLANVGCAVAAALAIGVDERHLPERLARLQPAEHRAQVVTAPSGLVVIDDTYNSNPEGAAAALKELTARVPDGRRAVVTPGMIELGPLQDEANFAFAEAVVDSGATLVVVGRNNRRALRAGAGGSAVCVESRDDAREWVAQHMTRGDGVLWENDLPDHYP
jgi:UDP-N-acetylmuramoyl-tripeptide--D-alanyl-D-alanine ligase